MATTKLTDLKVKKAAIPASGRTEYYDAALLGFGLRVSERGTKSWILFYRTNGRNRRLTLGRYPAIGLADARELARDALHSAAKGLDPGAEKVDARSNRPQLLHDVINEFIESYAKIHNRSWRETQRVFEREVLPRWTGRPIRSLTRSDIHDLLDGIMARGRPYMANRVLAAVRKLLNWAEERDYCDNAGITRIKAPGREVTRDRVLTDEELARIWRSAEQIGYPFGRIVQILILTGQRREEVAQMK